MPTFEINYLAVLVSAIAGFVIGALWYSVLFGKVWMKLSGMDRKKIEKEKKKGMAKSYAAGLWILRSNDLLPHDCAWSHYDRAH